MPNRVSRLRGLLPLILLLLPLLAAAPETALGCPTCKEAVAGNDPTHNGMVQGYFWSILFMMSMPFLILSGLSLMFYLEVRRARRLAALQAEGVSQPGEASSRGSIGGSSGEAGLLGGSA